LGKFEPKSSNILRLKDEEVIYLLNFICTSIFFSESLFYMKVCSNCNQTNPMEATFCRQCASPLGNNQSYQPPPSPPRSNQQPGWNPPQGNNQKAPQNFTSSSGGASSRAMAAAGLAAAALFCCGFLTGIPAAILGWLEVQSIREGKSSTDGMMMAQVGIWLGIAGTIINAVCTVILLAMMSLGGR
jgi:hypothetical protein